MQIRIGFDISFELNQPTPVILMLYTHPSRAADLSAPEVLNITPATPVRDYIDTFGNRCGRILAPAGTLRLTHTATVQDSGQLDELITGAVQHAVHELPPDVIQFLLASRYCEVDRLLPIAWDLFGKTPEGWERVQAVIGYVHKHITFGYHFARSTKTAWDAWQERTGVCRDYMHLAITFLRCLNIPARYATGYLGDIGVPYDPAPMDFSAWMEVYLSGRWYTMDARHNKQRTGRILQARGRDATDVALTTSFGNSTLKDFHVVCEEVKT